MIILSPHARELADALQNAGIATPDQRDQLIAEFETYAQRDHEHAMRAYDQARERWAAMSRWERFKRQAWGFERAPYGWKR